MDCILPGSSVHEILQARILEWVAILTPGHLPDPRIEPASPMSPALAGRFFTTSATWEAWWSPSFSWFTHSLFTVPSHGRERKLWPVHPPIKAPVSPWSLHCHNLIQAQLFPQIFSSRYHPTRNEGLQHKNLGEYKHWVHRMLGFEIVAVCL